MVIKQRGKTAQILQLLYPPSKSMNAMTGVEDADIQSRDEKQPTLGIATQTKKGLTS